MNFEVETVTQCLFCSRWSRAISIVPQVAIKSEIINFDRGNFKPKC